MASARRNWLSAIGPRDEADDDRRIGKSNRRTKKPSAPSRDHIAERPHAYKFENDD